MRIKLNASRNGPAILFFFFFSSAIVRRGLLVVPMTATFVQIAGGWPLASPPGWYVGRGTVARLKMTPMTLYVC